MKKNLVVSGCDFSFSLGTGTVNVTSMSSINVKLDGKAAYVSPMAIAVSGYTDGATIAEGVGVGIINGSSKKTKIDLMPAIREGDECTVILTGVNPTSGIPVSGIEVTVKISSAGQSEATSE